MGHCFEIKYLMVLDVLIATHQCGIFCGAIGRGKQWGHLLQRRNGGSASEGYCPAEKTDSLINKFSPWGTGLDWALGDERGSITCFSKAPLARMENGQRFIADPHMALRSLMAFSLTRVG